MRSLIAWAVAHSRLIASFILLTVGLMAAAALVVYTSYRAAAADLLIQRDRQLTYLAAARLRDQLTGLATELTSLAQVSKVARGTSSDRQQALQERQNRLVVFDGGVVILDSFGKVVASHPSRPEIFESDWSGRDYFIRQLTAGGLVISEMGNDGLDGAPVVTICVPIVGEQGEFAGALAGMFRLGHSELSSLYASIVRLRLDHSGSTYLVDGSGKILYDSAYKLVGQRFADSALSGLALEDEAGAIRTRDLQGHDVVAAHARVPGTNWVLVTEDDWATETASTERAANVMLGLIIAGILLPPVGVVLLARQRTIQTAEEERRVRQQYVAGVVGQALLPAHPPALPGWQIELGVRRAVEGGGDFYDFLFLPDGRLVVTLADIADRGLGGAVAMTVTRAALRSTARQALPPDQALALANELLCPELAVECSVACAYVLLEPGTGSVEIANGGLPPAYRLGPSGVRPLDATGPRLGLALGQSWQEQAFQLAPGEALVLYSDGLSNARNGRGDCFGPERLIAALERPQEGNEELHSGVFDELERFAGAGWTPGDDMTLLVVRRTAVEGGS